MHHLQWRLNDLAEETRPRWTRVHKIVAIDATTTLCGLAVPEHPYMANYDENTNPGAPVCDRCKAVARKAVRS